MNSNCNLTQSSYNGLQSVYQSLNGDFWAYSGNTNKWKFPSPLSEPCSIPWQGVKCTPIDMSTCVVTGLTLEKMNLTGILPSHLPPNLRNLSMHDNNIFGTLPSSWSSLNIIEILVLSGNSLTGTLPDEWNAFSVLRELRVGLNSLNGTLPVSWSKLSRTRHFDFIDNVMTGLLPDAWSTMSNLLYLDLSHNSFSGELPSSWSTMEIIELFAAANNTLTGTIPSSWSTMKDVALIDIYGNSLTQTLPSCWSSMNRMRLFDSSRNLLTGSLPESWSAMSDLILFESYSNSLTGTLPISWSSMKLEYFDADTNHINGTLPGVWSNWKHIKYIYVFNNALTGTLPDSWSQMSKMRSIFAYDNSLNGSIPESWGSLLELKDVLLFENLLTNTLPMSWCNNTGLKALYLQSNSLSGTLPLCYSVFVGLDVLFLHSNSFEGTLPSTWKNMTSMLLLSLYSNSLTGVLPNSWSSMKLMQYLFMQENDFTGTLPSSWGAMASILQFNCSNNGLTGTFPSSWGDMQVVHTLYLNRNNFHGPFPEEWDTLYSIEMFVSSYNILSGTLPASYSRMNEILWFNVRGNLIHGTIPKEYCNWPHLATLYLQYNRLSGTLNLCWTSLVDIIISFNQITSVVQGVPSMPGLRQFNLSHNLITQEISTISDLLLQPLVSIFDLSNNYFHGRFTYSDDLMVDTLLDTLDISNNCLSGYIDTSVCKFVNLTTFLASNVHNSYKCNKRMALHQGFPYPSCILTLPKMVTVNLIGNAMTGSLVDIDVATSQLSFVGLVSNRITGTIPKSWQSYGRFDQLLLSFNKITGALSQDFVVMNNMTNLNISLNRLSGTLPKSFGSLSHMDVIDGNIISCKSTYIYFQGNDVSRNTYECGSWPLTVVGYLYASILGLMTIIIGIRFRRFHAKIMNFLNTMIATCYDYANIIAIMTTISVITAVALAVLSVDKHSAMYFYEYGWVTTSAYIHGELFILMLTVVTISTAVVQYFVGIKYDSHRRRGKDFFTNYESSRVAAMNIHPGVLQRIRLILTHMLNIVVVGGLTVVYVMIVLTSGTSTAQLVYSIFLSFAKVMWGEYVIPHIFRKIILGDLLSSKKKPDVLQIVSMYPFVLLNEMAGDVWCYMLCPLLVILSTTSRCLKYFFLGVPDVTINYPSKFINLEFITLVTRNHSSHLNWNASSHFSENSTAIPITPMFTTQVVPFVTPIATTIDVNIPWLYSFQCSSSIVTSYIVIVYYTYFIFALIIPVVKPFHNKYVAFFLPKLTDIVLPEGADMDAESIHDRVSLAATEVTSMRHRTHIRHYVMFFIFGLASPLLGLLIIGTILVEDSMLTWEFNELRVALVQKHGMSEAFAKEQCERLLLRDVCNVYHRYFPWVTMISVGYWALYAFDSIGDIYGASKGLIAALVCYGINSVLVVIVFVLVDRYQHKMDNSCSTIELSTLSTNMANTEVDNVLLVSFDNTTNNNNVPPLEQPDNNNSPF